MQGNENNGGARVVAEGRFLRFVVRNGWEYVERRKVSGIVVLIAATRSGKDERHRVQRKDLVVRRVIHHTAVGCSGLYRQSPGVLRGDARPVMQNLQLSERRSPEEERSMLRMQTKEIIQYFDHGRSHAPCVWVIKQIVA